MSCLSWLLPPCDTPLSFLCVFLRLASSFLFSAEYYSHLDGPQITSPVVVLKDREADDTVFLSAVGPLPL